MRDYKYLFTCYQAKIYSSFQINVTGRLKFIDKILLLVNRLMVGCGIYIIFRNLRC